ncbi:putative regulator of V-ATPase in vacuolar membrane protein [Clavispora lusitaniae]|uniref:Regulator of V-ATPase in vacuolar membrane protein n=1 Tax=Clavispora lusitaniae TaxID=36911 RepID=A0ACD0WF89_CLALS|nr:putative regulator of V-ATPase in vacuolar membrane protein [Clavispora lusitaniae]QFZ31892.1 putative regulator of V-ATPase in vacuolar membrane protein [Clavispora lusitaniae]QFZ37561.1 putative regulator of V-ATPase in vacuolar membrane protein [Clavispora lusitaniae]QFZ43245.1 putative regulator of V-ATPase in vacuolar membrane protein [Clavispora lusitaniae]QFZ48921.1 putative regulator of V-ATPase in vacuolar membrane protein [Clavispora lusitaniae]
MRLQFALTLVCRVGQFGALPRARIIICVENCTSAPTRFLYYMTIQFVPGDPNSSLYSLDQAAWKNHRIVAYASGNNLIVYSLTDNKKRSLQTIYLDRDPTAVSINGDNGLICISQGSKVLVFRPVNEYMSVPKWTEAHILDVDGSQIHCLKWAISEEELAVGTDHSISLFHVGFEYGEIKANKRWSQTLASPVNQLDITHDSSKIVTYNSEDYDFFVKLWMRTSYDDVHSSFELTYMAHDRDKWLLSCRWREKAVASISEDDNKQILASMVNIKNMRNYIPQFLTESNDVLYTVTNDRFLNVWATYDFSGHRHLKQWAKFNLVQDLKSPFVTALIIENKYLQATLIPSLYKMDPKSDFVEFFSSKNVKNLDLLIVFGQMDSVSYSISNIESNPPNNIVFEKLSTFTEETFCLPKYDEVTINNIGKELDSGEYTNSIFSNPITVGHLLASPETNSLTYLVHDRLKSTIRIAEVSFRTHRGLDPRPRVRLKNKFQGHIKSIQKLITSSSSYEGNIMLSVSDFPDHNYIWEPLLLVPEKKKDMSITKRFILNVARNGEDNIHNQGIIDAILINDICPPTCGFRHHVAIVVEKGGYLSIWDCNGTTMDDKEAELVSRLDILNADNERITKAPQAFCLMGNSTTHYNIVCIFDVNLIKSWRVTIDDKTAKIACFSLEAEELPGAYSGYTKISAVDTFLEKDLSVIDEKGLFRSIGAKICPETNKVSWVQKNEIDTSIENASLIHGASLIHRLAIVDGTGSELTIWDSKSGLLEYKETFPPEYGPVRDIDWTFIGEAGSTANAILAVGFAHFVLLYTQLRYDYTNRIPTFAVLKKIDISEFSSHEIGDSIWIDGGYLVIGSGNQFFIDDKWVELGQNSGVSTSNSLGSTIRQLLVGFKRDENHFLISDLAKILNGPLPVYHPQFLIQALLMNEIEIVEEILIRLYQCLRTQDELTWNLDMDLAEALSKTRSSKIKRRLSNINSPPRHEKYDIGLGVFDTFSTTVSELLIEKLTKISLPLLTRHQQVTLMNVVNIVSSISDFESSVDENGLKFLCGFKLFQASTKQSRLTMRDISWAVHSDQKELLFSHVDDYYHHRLTWEKVKKVGIIFWIDKHRLTNLMETIARNEFGDSRDPSGLISLFYLAIKKKQVLLGLWKTASHPEREKVLKFMSNNFMEDRWRTAASKNAFVLLGKHRYMDASYFFLLAGKVKDCCITLCSKLDDVELALAVAKVNGDHESVMHIIENFVLPKALSKGDRWMTSWAFWEMKLKEVSIQALIKSPHLVVQQNVEKFSDNFKRNLRLIDFKPDANSFLRDDPSLAVLFRKLRASKFNYLKGSLAVSPSEEFDFVLKVSQIYSKMGCDYLAISLLRTWTFIDYGVTEDMKKKADEKDLFSEFSAAPTQKIEAASTAFEEPDMSAFSFGF